LCKRCGDATELNTFLGAVKCPSCAGISIGNGAERFAANLLEGNNDNGNNDNGNNDDSSPATLNDLFKALMQLKKSKDIENVENGHDNGQEHMGYLLPVNPLDYFGEYKCKCGKSEPGLTVFALTKSIEETLDVIVLYFITESVYKFRRKWVLGIQECLSRGWRECSKCCTLITTSF